MTLTTNELKLFADMLAERGDQPLLLDRLRHEIATRTNTEPQVDFLVNAYGDTVLTRWPILSRVFKEGLRDIMYNLAVDCASVGHAEGHSCSREDK